MNDNRFKFRVWDKKNNEYVPEGQMCDVHCLLWRDGTLDCGISYDDGYAGGIDWIKTEDAIIEQCTGLKDKNNNLIYEGDVVSFSWQLKDNEVCKIVWDKIHCSFACVDIKTGADFITWYSVFENGQSNRCEIIGNIHNTEIE